MIGNKFYCSLFHCFPILSVPLYSFLFCSILFSSISCLSVLFFSILFYFFVFRLCSILFHFSRIVRKPDFCLCENKDADQLRSNCEADQRLCFRHSDSTIPFLLKTENFKLLALVCNCTGRFMWDLVGNPEDRFSRVEAHSIPFYSIQAKWP